MGAAKRVEAEQRRMRTLQMAADERTAREQAEAERLAKRARRWRGFVDPLRREPPILDDAMPDLGEVANDMTGRPQVEPSLVAEPQSQPAAEEKVGATTDAKPSAADPLDDVKRMLGELAETVRQQKTVIDAQATTITQLQQQPKPVEMPKAEPIRQAVNGDSGGWMPGSRNGHATASAPPARNLDDIRFNGAGPSPLAGTASSTASPTADRSLRARSYHELSDALARGARLATPAQVIPMPYMPHVDMHMTTNGALADTLHEAPSHHALLDAIIEASERSDVEAIEPIVEDVTAVEPIDEWAPAPGLGGKPVEAAGMSSLEDIQRFIDRSRNAAQNIEAEITGNGAKVAESVEQPANSDNVENELFADDLDETHATERADFNVPMITQWWARKS
jgi:hypothetical protein